MVASGPGALSMDGVADRIMHLGRIVVLFRPAFCARERY